jgi:hypothetical protein
MGTNSHHSARVRVFVELTRLHDVQVELRIFSDVTFIEAYFQQGRTAMTAVVSLNNDSNIEFTATDTNVNVVSATAYPIAGIWTTPEAVKNQPRVYA